MKKTNQDQFAITPLGCLVSSGYNHSQALDIIEHLELQAHRRAKTPGAVGAIVFSSPGGVFTEVQLPTKKARRK
jgi:hypothetical protein